MAEILPIDIPLKDHTGMTILNTEYNNDIFLYQQTNENYALYGVNKTIPDMFIPDDIVTEFAELKSIIETEVSKWMASFVLGVSNINDENDWNNYHKTLDSLDSARYLEIYQRVYDSNYSR